MDQGKVLTLQFETLRYIGTTGLLWKRHVSTRVWKVVGSNPSSASFCLLTELGGGGGGGGRQ